MLLCNVLCTNDYVQARGSRCEHNGHLHRSHGAQLHGRPPQQQAEVGAGVGWVVCLRGRTISNPCSVQGRSIIIPCRFQPISYFSIVILHSLGIG